MVETGELAPDFTLKNQDDSYISLADFRGKKIVLYFCPSDLSSDCMQQAISFRDMQDEFKERGIVVIGVSANPTSVHQKFKDKEDLPFDLLSDEDTEVAKDYDTFDETEDSILQKTFLINEHSEVVHVFDEINCRDHAEEVLDAWDMI